MKKKLKIKIFTRSCNDYLYKLSGETINIPYERVRIKYSTADGYFLKMLKSDADIAINLDEDAFICDNKKLQTLLDFFLSNNYTNCGMPDGGVVPIRFHNPLITNPFFNILDLRTIRDSFNFKILNEYKKYSQEFELNSPRHLLKTNFMYDMYEPYYPFFLWISQNFKVLYLDASVHSDNISTQLYDHNGDLFLLHSWYSRYYGLDPIHTNRINALAGQCGVSPRLMKPNNINQFENRYIFPSVITYRKVLKKLGIRKFV